ncbi:MAG: ammonia-forming cytochrome c nitrite reductase subunit c552 [Deltaproteobacteria bacterium]|nr:ammonia-forming cytochrome c nitrite reductase subunit c552 [Deltaproteobacteria bacterium]
MRAETKEKVAFLLGCFLALLLFLFFLFSFAPSLNDASKTVLDREAEDFFKSYWARPIPLQGSPPPSFTEKEASLRPEACGSCHPQQYADWKESLHSRAMGPGPWGQILDLTQNNPQEAILCMTCHAPLGEQIPVLTSAADGKNYAKNPGFDAELQLRGITCAACHVRRHQRFGPPQAEQSSAPRYAAGTPNHGGVQRTPYFKKAEFCEDCHQFDPENTVLVNGKPIQDTYREWKDSLWGKGEAACQDCHMPGRRHLWKGIHDKEWVERGVRIEAHLKEAAPTPGRPLELSVEVTNAAVGHKFPTYITPKVFVRAALLDDGGNILPGTNQEKIIGWDARFEGGEWKEYFDTRIPPAEKSAKNFKWNRPTRAKKVRAWVEVHPDHFYHVHFYPPYLKDENLSREGRKLIEKALKESGSTSYVLFEELIPLK